jgi:hypoxanthine phosphoribosyltransferase
MIPEGFSRLLTHDEIRRRTKELADELRPRVRDCHTKFVGVLDGAVFFLADLVRELQADVKLDFLRVSSYNGAETGGELKLVADLAGDVAGADVVVVDDIFDSGRTLEFCRDHLRARGAVSVAGVVLLAKERPRLSAVDEPLVGFRIPDRFVIGYGLDWQGRCRQLRDIYIKDTPS